MRREALASNALVSAGYDAATQTLEVEFKSGRVYRYFGVPQGTYDWLCRSQSKGAFISRMVSSRYDYEVIASETPAAEPQDLAAALRASLLARDKSR